MSAPRQPQIAAITGMKNGMVIVPSPAIAVPTPKANERLSGAKSVATVLIVSGVCTASVAPRPMRAATTCQPATAQPCAIAARLHVVTPAIMERSTPILSTSHPVNRKDSAAATCVTKARLAKSVSVQPRSAEMSGFRIAMTGRSMALKMPATHSSPNSVQRSAGVIGFMTLHPTASLSPLGR